MEAFGGAPNLPSTEEWARAARGRGNSRVCLACDAPEPVREALETVLRMRDRGETSVSMTQLSDYVAQRFGVKLGKYVLQNHFAHHTELRWKSGREA